MIKNIYPVNLAILVLLIFSSCVNTRKSLYFAGQTDASIASNIKVPEPKVESNDLLSISVTSLDQKSTELFNAPNVNTSYLTTYNGAPIQSSGYLVDQDGNIQYPVLGAIKVSGLTLNELSALITKKLVDGKYLLSPIVTVRHLNFKVTVLGEVGRPAVINVPNEKITLLEALGLAGDITIYGKKDNVLVIREANGVKNVKRLDLNTSEIFNSPYYYLQSNDIVYVEPNKARVASSGRSTQLLPIILSGLSFLAIVVDRVFRNN